MRTLKYAVFLIILSLNIHYFFIQDPHMEFKLKIYHIYGKIMTYLIGLGTDNFSRSTLNYLKSKVLDTNGKFVIGVKVSTTTVKSLIDDYKIPIEIYIPESALNRKLPLIFNIHGGGFVINGIPGREFRLVKHDFVVIGIDYRLSPEHKFPFALEDCYSVLNWISESKLDYVDYDKVSILGDSAGGNLAITLNIFNKMRGLNFKIHKLALIYPGMVMKEETPSAKKFKDGYLLTKRLVDWFINQYIRNDDDLNNPLVNPLKFDDFKDFPQTFVQLATDDILYSEGLMFSDKLREFNNDVNVKEYVACHGFFDISSKISDVALNDLVSFLLNNSSV